MSLSPNELSFHRLLERTRKLATGDLHGNVHKVKSAVAYLSGLLSKIQDEKVGHDVDVLMQYGREVNQLRILVESEEKKDITEKLVEVQRLPTSFPNTDRVGLNSNDNLNERGGNVRAGSALSSSEPSSGSGLRLRARAVYTADLRKQLLGEDAKAKAHVEDISHHDEVQANLAEELLNATKALKQNMTVAGNVIKEDNVRLEKMNVQADTNLKHLKTEGERLARHAYKCGFECMLVFIALFVFWSFISMVVVMKVFPKPAYY